MENLKEQLKNLLEELENTENKERAKLLVLGITIVSEKIRRIEKENNRFQNYLYLKRKFFK